MACQHTMGATTAVREALDKSRHRCIRRMIACRHTMGATTVVPEVLDNSRHRCIQRISSLKNQRAGGGLSGSTRNAASSYSGKLQSPVTLLVTKSNSDNDENGWHNDNNSYCEYQVDDDKAATLLMTKSNSDNDENGWQKDNNSDCDYKVDDDKELFVRLADGLPVTQEDKMPQGITACAETTIDGGMDIRKTKNHAHMARGLHGSSPTT